MKVNPLWPSVVNSPLVIDGETVKLRLQAERKETGNKVHVDWVRFTTRLKNAPVPPVEVLFPTVKTTSIWDQDLRYARIIKTLRDLPDSDFCASSQAYELASRVAQCMGSDFIVNPDHKKGIDFYKHRWSIELNGCEVAWVGFLASGDSPRQSKQSETIHANIMGSACTFASSGWRIKLADLIDHVAGDLTRADLALDFFDGYSGGIEAVRTDYRNGVCNVGGRKLKFNMVGDWENQNNRSLYVGSREAGKVTNVYEKGDQLYGEKANSDWLRFELRYGNKLRVLHSDILRRPDDFFAGASDWHQSVLLQAQSVHVAAQIKCIERLPVQTIEAECTRNINWMLDTALSTMAIAIKTLDTDKLMDFCRVAKLPGRLKKFNESLIMRGMNSAFQNLLNVAPLPTVQHSFQGA